MEEDALKRAYMQLLELITLQHASLQQEKFEELEALTQKKKAVMERIEKSQNALTSSRRETVARTLEKITKKIIREDKKFMSLLKEKEAAFGDKIQEVRGARKNVTKMRPIYGKKFTEHPLFDKEG